MKSLREPAQTLLTSGKMALNDKMLFSTAFQLPEQTVNEIFDMAKNELANIAKLSFHDLMKFKNIGANKAASIVASFEVGRRRYKIDPAKSFKIQCSNNAYEYIRPFLLDEQQEHFYILMLNRANRVINHKLISSGGTAATVVDSKLIFKSAIENYSQAIILIHNHPSENLKPSQADIAITKKLVNIGKELEMPVLDHLIFANSGYYSFADEGLI